LSVLLQLETSRKGAARHSERLFPRWFKWKRGQNFKILYELINNRTVKIVFCLALSWWIHDNSDQRQIRPSQLRPLLRQLSVHHLLKKCGAIYGPGF
jgi:hypothetical protein